MKLPTIEILKRTTLNDWFGLHFDICNSIMFEVSLFGYGLRFDWIMKEPRVEFVESYSQEE